MAHFMLALIMASAAADPAAFAVRAVSPRMGLTFADSEPLDVRARVANATAAVTVAFSVREVAGPWEQTGEVTLADLQDGAGEVALPLEVPERGLYTLSLEARCGDRKATSETSLGVVFSPEPVAEDSPWGIFYIPFTFEGRTADQSMVDIARNIRLLGASWVRFNFWAHTYGKVTVTPGDPPTVTGDWSEAKKMVRALRAEGLHIMGEIAQCPRELSSQPDATDVTGDAGPVYNRVKPADYAIWDLFIERLARDFADDIPVWEIWNEANLPNAYWTGTVEDFAELIHHTSAALMAGQPQSTCGRGWLRRRP